MLPKYLSIAENDAILRRRFTSPKPGAPAMSEVCAGVAMSLISYQEKCHQIMMAFNMHIWFKNGCGFSSSSDHVASYRL